VAPQDEIRVRLPSSYDAVVLAGALNGDEFVAAAARTGISGGRYRTGDLFALDFAERRSEVEVTRLAISGSDRKAAACPCGQAPIDPIVIGTVCDDEKTLFSLGSNIAEENRHAGNDGKVIPHRLLAACAADRYN